LSTIVADIKPPPWQPPWKKLRLVRATPDQLLAGYEVTAPPVPVELIARKMGAQVHRVRKPGWDGALSVDGDVAHIWVDGGVAPTRQRFTVAHEIGHLLLHYDPSIPDRVQFRDHISMLGVDPMEREANRFAAELLMPAWMVHAFLPGRTVGQLAAIFDVSEPAMGIRVQALRRGRAFG
jgi:hypothetical protein